MNTMELHLTVAQKHYKVHSTDSVPIAIPMDFRGEQPNTYGVDRASAKTYKLGPFVGDVRRGGSCNFETYSLIPHCVGTHTECIGHITAKRISIHEQIKDALIPATLVSVPVIPAKGNIETYTPELNDDDLIVSGHNLEQALVGADMEFLRALVIRTMPNDVEKCGRDYVQQAPPFFTHAAMKLITRLGVEHLLVDFPSLDRMHDEGMLSNHRIYWNMEHGSFAASKDSRDTASVTEMIYVPDTVADGPYLLNLQFPSFIADASPSKPVLFPITEIEQS
jgi:putative cyclase